MSGAIRLCRKEKVAIDLSSREVENKWEGVTRRIYISLPLGLRKVISFLRFRLGLRKK
jgi:hypothetical protein